IDPALTPPLFPYTTLFRSGAGQFAQLSNEILTNGGMAPNPAFADPSAFGRGTDWLDAFLGSGRMGNVTLSFTQGNENSSVYSSLDRKSTRLNSSHVKISYA